MKRKPQETPEINAPKGYNLDDLMDTDDSGYDFEEAILYEEVSIQFERENGE